MSPPRSSSNTSTQLRSEVPDDAGVRPGLQAPSRAQHKKTFRYPVPEFTPWPNSMRVKPLKSAQGVWEFTWSMNEPDGRATWEWAEVGGEPAVRWRRIGDHDVLDKS